MNIQGLLTKVYALLSVPFGSILFLILYLNRIRTGMELPEIVQVTGIAMALFVASWMLLSSVALSKMKTMDLPEQDMGNVLKGLFVMATLYCFVLMAMYVLSAPNLSGEAQVFSAIAAAICHWITMAGFMVGANI